MSVYPQEYPFLGTLEVLKKKKNSSSDGPVTKF